MFDRSNYRPISVLPLLSLKFLSVTFIKLFTTFFCKHEPLLDSQFAFRSYHSSELAITDRSDDILANTDNELFNGLLLVDLKKTFDLVDT